MRRLLLLLLLVVAYGANAAAQLPPIIKKPIDAAKKAAAATNAQSRAVENADKAEQKQQPAAAAQSAPQSKAAPAAAGAPSAAKPRVDVAPGSGQAAAAKGAEAPKTGKAPMTFYREEYAYSDDGRRDPFMSLLATSEIRPLLADLVLIGVIYDLAGRNSVASLLDATSGETYRVKAGNILGRMKVAKIGQESITLNIDEFGFSRQETLLLNRTSRKAGGAPGRRIP